MNWDWAFVWEYLPSLLQGFGLTIIATILASLVSVVLGLFWAICRRSSIAPIRLAVTWFTEFVRRTPLLVQLYFIFFVLPSIGLTLPPLVCGVIGLGLHYSTYAAEIYRAGINSVDKGQWEAAKALDLPTRQVWARVVLPQAVPRVVPALGNTVIAMFKETALLSAISVQELMGVAKSLGATTYHYTESLLVAGVLYLAISYGASVVIRAVERRLNVKKPKRLAMSN